MPAILARLLPALLVVGAIVGIGYAVNWVRTSPVKPTRVGFLVIVVVVLLVIIAALAVMLMG